MNRQMTANTPAATAERQNPQVVRTKNAVLTAAQQLITEVGVGGVTFERLSEVSGVARSTIYRYWPSTAELIVDAFAALIMPLPPILRSRSLAENLLDNYDWMMRQLHSSRWSALLPAMIEGARLDEGCREVFHRLLRERRQWGHQIIDYAIENGEIDPDIDSDWLFEAISGPLYYRAVVMNAPVLDNDYLRHLVEMVVDRVKSGKAPKRR